MNIGGIEVGGANPCAFVAEVSNAHNGDFARAHRLIAAIATTGAEFIKFQSYTPDELVALRGDGPAPEPWGAQGWSMRALYEKARTPLVWLPELFQHARDIGLVPFSSVFGLESLAACEAASCGAYKIAALDNGHTWLRDAARATGKPVLMSVRREQRHAAGCVQSSEKFEYLLCPAQYPTPAASFAFEQYDFEGGGDDNEQTGWGPEYLGISSHCLAPELPIAAVARGCKLLEYHVMLDDEPSELEASVSLSISAFRDMVQAVRRTEEMIG